MELSQSDIQKKKQKQGHHQKCQKKYSWGCMQTIRQSLGVRIDFFFLRRYRWRKRVVKIKNGVMRWFRPMEKMDVGKMANRVYISEMEGRED